MPSGVRHDSPQEPAPPMVVVGVDGSEESKDALCWAVDSANPSGARVTVCRRVGSGGRGAQDFERNDCRCARGSSFGFGEGGGLLWRSCSGTR